MAGPRLGSRRFSRNCRKRAPVENIELIGRTTMPKRSALLDEADALVCPSRDETMPIVILEAMGLGKGSHQHRRRRRAGMDPGRNERSARGAGKSGRAGARHRRAASPSRHSLAQLAARARDELSSAISLWRRFAARFGRLLQSLARRPLEEPVPPRLDHLRRLDRPI